MSISVAMEPLFREDLVTVMSHKRLISFLSCVYVDIVYKLLAPVEVATAQTSQDDTPGPTIQRWSTDPLQNTLDLLEGQTLGSTQGQ